MKKRIWCLCTAVPLTIVFSMSVLSQSRVKEPDLSTLLEKVAERVKAYYLDLQRLAWTDTVQQQTLNENRSPQGSSTDLVYDMIIRLDPAEPRTGVPAPLPPFFTRELAELTSRNGKRVGQDDRLKPGDPKYGDIGLLWILLWAPTREEHKYRFSYADPADLDGRKTLTVNIEYPPTGFIVGPIEVIKTGDSNRVPRVVWQEDSFTVWVQQTGRIWIDPITFDVLQLETRTKPFEFENSNGPGKLKFEFQRTTRFKSITFDDPKQTFIVPDSIETVRTIKGMQPPLNRTVHTFGNYKRFSADVQLLPTEIVR